MFHFNKYKSLSLEIDKLIVGLGNIGITYDGTRHNSGFEAVSRIAEKLGTAFNQIECDAYTGVAEYAGKHYILAKPTTYMNLSGKSVSALMNKYKLKPEQLLVLYDDLDLPLGTLRLRAKGSAGTHNGMRDIVADLGYDNFQRLRIGIGRPGAEDIKDFVLGKPFGEDRDLWNRALDTAAEATIRSLNGDPNAVQRFLAEYNRSVTENEEK